MEEPKISTKSITEKGSSYKRWVASEGIPIIEGFFIEDIRKVPLSLGSARGIGGPFAQGTGETNDPISVRFLPARPWTAEHMLKS
jgi:hypothetical protein